LFYVGDGVTVVLCGGWGHSCFMSVD